MKIIITESQYKLLKEMTQQDLKKFLFSLWNTQKSRGEEPSLDDIIYQVTEIRKDSADDYVTIRPIWYEYNGGYKKILQEMKDKLEHGEFHIKGGSNLNMEIFVDEVYSYGEDRYGGMVDIICRVIGGTVDGYEPNEETGGMDIVPNMDIFEQYEILEYDTQDFEQFLTDEVYGFFSNLLKDRLIPIHIDLMIK